MRHTAALQLLATCALPLLLAASCGDDTSPAPATQTATDTGPPDAEVPRPDADADARINNQDRDAPAADTGDVVVPPVDATEDTTDIHAPDLVEDTDPPEDALVLSAPSHVSLPFFVVGEGVSRETLGVTLSGSGVAPEGSLLAEVDGPFEVSGAGGALEVGVEHELEVRFAGPSDVAGAFEGLLTLRLGAQVARVALSVVVGATGLGASNWVPRDGGLVNQVSLPSAPYPTDGGQWTDDTVLIAIPDGYVGRGGGFVVHLHGHNASLPRTAQDQLLVEQHDLSGRNAILVIPQGPVEASSGDFGKLVEQGGLSRLLRDVVAVLYRDQQITRLPAPEVVLTAHSGGYRAVAELIADPEAPPLVAVHLLDALYGQVSAYERFAAGGGRLRSLYTSSGGTLNNNEALRGTLRGMNLAVSEESEDVDLRATDLTIAFSPFSHAGHVSAERNYARLLGASGLPASPLAPPELLSVVSVDGEMAQVEWREDAGGSLEVVVEGSEDAMVWEVLGATSATRLEVPARPWIRVSAQAEGVLGASSDRYGATGGEWLVVDGFDRVFGGSWSLETHGFGAALGVALGRPFSVASDEAVAEGRVDLSAFEGVLWMLGDESRQDITFSPAAQGRIELFLADGGKMIVSGAEVGFATPAMWLGNVLGATYVSDDAGTNAIVEGYTFGVAYEEDYPDVLDGESVIWRYETGGAAAVGHQSRIITVGFPLETLADADRAPAMAELVGWLE